MMGLQNLRSSVVGDVAFSGEVVGRDRLRAGADEAVGRRSAGGISVVTRSCLRAEDLFRNETSIKSKL